ncbi:MAG: chromate transporter [Tabrizicola sp.]|uniref:chromate transporter n=1 Tax=Tabrizicola sp. TaxID=2005166 RepID=UPI0027351394|nr:chromate transporter [Tabrizicola sp.]MDP3263884.1 chromate transporter [Tabrizicola sp.]MDP3647248.1 chromate transporter [Paracoccaceae bacterium]
MLLAWMAQDAVQATGWLTLRQMIDGLGLAETTPGALILVTGSVGYMAAQVEGGVMLGRAAAVTPLITFGPCFGFICTGAPFIARLTAMPAPCGWHCRTQPRLSPWRWPVAQAGGAGDRVWRRPAFAGSAGAAVVGGWRFRRWRRLRPASSGFWAATPLPLAGKSLMLTATNEEAPGWPDPSTTEI